MQRHKCKKRQAFVIQLHMEPVEEETTKVVVAEVENPGLIELSFQVFQGLVRFRTMRIMGMHGRRQLFILVDSGSTHNF